MPGPQPYANTLFRFTPPFTPHRREESWPLRGASGTPPPTNLPQTFWLLAGEGFIPPVSLTPAFLKSFSCKIPFSAL